MVGYCSCGQEIKFNQCCHLGAYENLGKWVLLCKKLSKFGTIVPNHKGKFIHPSKIQNTVT